MRKLILSQWGAMNATHEILMKHSSPRRIMAATKIRASPLKFWAGQQRSIVVVLIKGLPKEPGEEGFGSFNLSDLDFGDDGDSESQLSLLKSDTSGPPASKRLASEPLPASTSKAQEVSKEVLPPTDPAPVPNAEAAAADQ